MFHVTYLTLKDFEVICQELQHFFIKNNDPLPNFQQSYFDKLDSVIATPKRSFDKKDLYQDIFAKAACYFYFINKLHPFNNANKRTSIVATGVFLLSNGYEFTADETVMYEFAKSVTLSKREQKKEFDEVVVFIKKHSKKMGIILRPRFIFDILKFLRRK